MTSPSAQRWHRLRPLLDEVLALDPAGREAYLAKLARRRPEDAAELAALARAHDDPPAILEGWSGEASEVDAGDGQATPRARDPRIGSRVGAYRLLERLGEGGMATVYRAERVDGGFAHRVAIKLLHAGSVTDGMRRRLREEQRILASLSHPGIARLYDGGILDDGTPFIVMELVEGTPLTAYCDRRNAGIDARLALFETVCRAVEHAHANLVIHRDLKPSNILVTDDGQVRLLDFGIATLARADGDEARRADTVTSHYGAAATPAYAAPEQLSGGPSTTAIDIYALGVVLYELLTGRLPFPRGGALPPRVAGAVLAGEPERPSLAVRRAGEADAERFAGAPRRWSQRLEGDLDTIVLYALRADPARRYPSVALLREDLERHRDHLVVRARPESFRYRAGRFARRHRLAVGLGAALILALAGGLTLALASERRARREARTAAQVSGFLAELFRAPDPSFGRGGETSARDLLDEADRRIETELRDEPEVRASLQMVIAESYLGLGDHDRAEAAARSGADSWAELRGETDPETVAARNLVAGILRDAGRLDEAAALYRDLETSTAGLSLPPELRATMVNDHGLLERARGDDAAAEAAYRAALAIHRREGTLDTQDGIRARNNLATVLGDRGDLEAAEALLREVLAAQRATMSEPHADIASSLNNLALVVRQRGDLDAAVGLAEEALRQRRTVLGDRHPAVAQSINNLGTMRFYRGDLDGAASSFEEALALWRAAYPDDHPRLADALSNLAAIRRRQGRFPEAVGQYRAAAEMQVRLLGADHPSVATAWLRLGSTLLESGDAAAARPVLERALAIAEARFGPGDRPLVRVRLELAAVARRLGDRRTAEEQLEKAARDAGDDATLRAEVEAARAGAAAS